MSNGQVTEQMLQRAAWRRRIIDAILERKFDDETLVTMLMAGFDHAHAEGLIEAADLCNDVAAGSPPARRVASTLERALRRLVEMNKTVEMALPTGIDPVSSA